MHKATITKSDRAALENLWGEAGEWIADTWTALNDKHFGGRLKYGGIVWGLTPHGRSLGHTSPAGRITLHPALLDPAGSDPWNAGHRLGACYAEHVLLHEMIHVKMFAVGVENTKNGPHHNTAEWCAEITRITGELGLLPIKAMPVLPRRVDGLVVREAHPGYLERSEIAHWPQSIAPAGYYSSAGRIAVPI